MTSTFGKASALRDELTPTLLAIAIFSCMGAFTFGFDSEFSRTVRSIRANFMPW